MRRRNFYLTNEQNSALEKMSELSVSEHLRRAIDEYIEKHISLLVAISPSNNGKRTK